MASYLWLPMTERHGLMAAGLDLSRTRAEEALRQMLTMGLQQKLAFENRLHFLSFYTGAFDLYWFHNSPEERKFLVEKVFESAYAHRWEPMVKDINEDDFPEEPSSAVYIENTELRVYEDGFTVVAHVDEDSSPTDDTGSFVPSKKKAPYSLISGVEDSVGSPKSSPLEQALRAHQEELQVIMGALKHLIQPDEIPTWLASPQSAWGGRKALDLVLAGEGQVVREFLREQITKKSAQATS